MRIVLDAMGGDHAPHEPVKGAVRAAKMYGSNVVLVGDEAQIRAELKQYDTRGLNLMVVHAPEQIEMDEHPAQAIRRKSRSSHVIGLKLVQEGVADAFVSAGHSGASMAGALFILGRLPQIERPALATILPSLHDRPMLLLDVGANTDCKPEYLAQFAQMGSIYAERTLGIPTPRIGLLANGEESTKGNRLVQEAHLLLRESNLNFIGNAEPKDLLVNDVCDVVVCDGFVGNLVLKMGEATVSLAAKRGALELRRSFLPRLLLGVAPIAALALQPGPGRWRTLIGAAVGGTGMAGIMLYPLWRLRRVTDYRVYGGAPLLGVKGVVIIAHGRSDAVAVAS
ncbi:MAG: phosphate acyltransferase PlsX, partial [Chloroflexaceae bacterium]|nr:phosphate acyltransferase PlsX [Chloroflexaceae bacterium]